MSNIIGRLWTTIEESVLRTSNSSFLVFAWDDIDTAILSLADAVNRPLTLKAASRRLVRWMEYYGNTLNQMDIPDGPTCADPTVLLMLLNRIRVIETVYGHSQACVRTSDAVLRYISCPHRFVTQLLDHPDEISGISEQVPVQPVSYYVEGVQRRERYLARIDNTATAMVKPTNWDHLEGSMTGQGVIKPDLPKSLPDTGHYKGLKEALDLCNSRAGYNRRVKEETETTVSEPNSKNDETLALMRQSWDRYISRNILSLHEYDSNQAQLAEATLQAFSSSPIHELANEYWLEIDEEHHEPLLQALVGDTSRLPSPGQFFHHLVRADCEADPSGFSISIIQIARYVHLYTGTTAFLELVYKAPSWLVALCEAFYADWISNEWYLGITKREHIGTSKTLTSIITRAVSLAVDFSPVDDTVSNNAARTTFVTVWLIQEYFPLLVKNSSKFEEILNDKRHKVNLHSARGTQRRGTGSGGANLH